MVASVRHIIYQQCISKVSIKIPSEKIRKVLMINNFIMSGTFKAFIIPFIRKLDIVLVKFVRSTIRF
jgi:hypothetical protein